VATLSTASGGPVHDYVSIALRCALVLRQLRLIGVLTAVCVIAGGAWVSAAVDTVDEAAKVVAPAHRVDAPTTTGAPAQNTLAGAVVTLLNTERASRGLAPYADQPQVAEAAQAHSADMAAHRNMSHTGSDGSNAGDRLTANGFTWRAWGENIAAGQRTAHDVVTAWINSTGHRPQMLGSYSYVGVGVAAAADGTLYWTLVVAT
jgi:uncharacterized protein YkwD